ncbi:MAG: autotransporter domain-containing protein, partial [Akkermansia sp.]|nr:autotransporter domain-containing protein [Akkermansia sp.]
GNGDWSGLSWSAQNADAPNPPAVDPGKMAADFEGKVIFDGDTTAAVNVDVDAKVRAMLVENGSYTFDGAGSLEVADKLTIGENGSAALDVATTVKDIELAGATSSLSTSAGLEVSGKLTATDGGTITNTGTEAVKLTGAELGSVSLLGSGGYELTDAILHGQITNTDTTIAVSGTQTLHKADLVTAGAVVAGTDINTYTDIKGVTPTDGSGNGYLSTTFTAALFTDGTKVSGDDSSTWVLSDGSALNVVKNTDGTFTFTSQAKGTEYYSNSGSVDYNSTVFADSETQKTTALVLNGGALKLSTNLADTAGEGFIRADKAGVVVLANGVTLNQSSIKEGGEMITISGGDGAIYVLDKGGIKLLSNVQGFDSNDWEGTVKTGAINGGLTPVDISGLGNANSTVEADSISGVALTAGTVGTVDVLGDVSLTNGDSTVNTMEVGGKVSLGATAESSLDAAVLTVNGTEGIALQNGSDITADTLTVANGGMTLSEGSEVEAGTLTVGAGISMAKGAAVQADELVTGGLSLDEGSSVNADTLTVNGSIEYKSLAADAPITVGDLTNDALDLTIDTALLKEAVDAGQDVTLMSVTNGSDAEISLNGGSNILKNYGEKYSYTVDWDDAGVNVTLDAVANENYMKEKFSGGSANGMAGATLMDEAFANGGVGDGELEAIMNAVDAENSGMTDEHMAAIAGSSTAALGMAFAGDVERQLRAIRNRTTTMGVNQCVVNEGMPYFNAWVNAEGNMGELDKDGTYAGYKLDSWGGTVGFDVDVNPNLTLGLAVTAMYGDLTVDGPDMLDGDMDTYYVTAFARYSKRAWTHTFIGTVGKMDGSYERTVNHAGGSYTAEGDTDGLAFGLMYEVGRVYALTEDGDACLQPVFNVAYRHTTVNGYTEKGGNASLDVDDQTLDTITLGAGARMQAVVGENLYNRTSVLELRALAKLDVGDRASEADVAFIGGGSRATVESAELGAFGVELGAGLSIPVGDENDGTIFFDVSAELRSGYSNVNGTVGYRINF